MYRGQLVSSKKKMSIPSDWTFRSEDVASAFDGHVREQLPWYDFATGAIAHIARHYIPEGGTVIDIGASTGNIGRALGATLDQRRARFIPLDNSSEMAGAYAGPGNLHVVDARSFDYAAERPDLIIAFLVMMFVPVADRCELIDRLKGAIRPGGAVVIFDKMHARAGHVGSVIYRLTLAAKYEAGASPEEVIQKELSLAGVQRPMSDAELSGFEPVFRFGDFAGFLFERPA